MVRSFLTALGFGLATAPTLAAPPYAPYKSDAANGIYNLLFCDDRAKFQQKAGESPTSWQTTLFSEPPDRPALSALASDLTQEGRIRYLAYSRLRELGQSVPAKIVLGIVVEVPLDGGLDALAAFSEGGVRYVNQSGKLVVIEGVEEFLPRVKQLFAVAEPVVRHIGPWDKPRLPPPDRGRVRVTFLVSDGLYFGEGPMSVMQRDQMAGPLIQEATRLLQATVAAGTR
jgi:hypothetical protein